MADADIYQAPDEVSVNTSLIIELLHQNNRVQEAGFAAINQRLDKVNGSIARHEEQLGKLETARLTHEQLIANVTTARLQCVSAHTTELVALKKAVEDTTNERTIVKRVAGIVAGTVTFVIGAAVAVVEILNYINGK